MVCDPASVATSIITSSVCCAWQEYSEKGRRDGIRQDMKEEYWQHRISEQELLEKKCQQLLLLNSITTNSNCSIDSNNERYCNRTSLSFNTNNNNYDQEKSCGTNNNNMAVSKHSSWSAEGKEWTSRTNHHHTAIHMSTTWPVVSKELLIKSRKSSLIDFEDSIDDDNDNDDDNALNEVYVTNSDDDGSMETIFL